MPWKAFKDGEQWCVREHDADGNPVGDALGCHDREEDAQEQMRALYVNAKETENEMPDVVAETDDTPTEYVREFTVGEFKGDVPTVPPADGVDLDALTKDDGNPFYITLPVARVGQVSKNGLEYDAELVSTIVSQINDRRPTGIMGHLKDEERGTAYPVPDVYWIGAVQVGDTAHAKGYLPPGAAREHYRRLKSVRGRAATSIYGGVGKREMTEGKTSWRARGFRLEQLDLAPYERAALPLGGQFSITAEMEEPTPTSSTEVKMADKNEIIAELTINDLPQTLRDAVIAEYEAAQQSKTRIAELEQAAQAKDTRIAELETAQTGLQERIAEFEKVAFDSGLDQMIAELTAWEVKGDEGKAKLGSLRATIKKLVQAELGTVREMETVKETAQTVMETVKELVSTVRDSLAGPAVVVAAKRDQGTTHEPTQEDIDSARARTGI